jgi:hypothetical protein
MQHTCAHTILACLCPLGCPVILSRTVVPFFTPALSPSRTHTISVSIFKSERKNFHRPAGDERGTIQQNLSALGR